MKKAILLGLLSICLPLASLAHESIIAMTKEFSGIALDKFAADDAERAESFRGLKAWPEGHAIKVKIYFGKTESLTYTCHEVEQDGKVIVHCM